MRPPGRIAGWLFVLLLSIYLLSIGGTAYSIDGHFSFEMAKSWILDPKHEYFRRFRTAFIRWGMLSPVLAQPLMQVGDAVARWAPQRDELAVDGHRYRLETWPVVGAAPAANGRRSFQVAFPRPVEVAALHLISFLSDAVEVPDGATIAVLRLRRAGHHTATVSVQAGRQTAEWAWDRADVRRRVAHRQARVAGRWSGTPRGRYYYAVLEVSPPVMSEGLEVAFTGTTGAFNVMALAVRDASSGALVDVRTDDRLWSRRQNRDVFLRLAYAVLPALATAVTAVLVYATVRELAYSASVAVVAALGFGLGTMAWPYAKFDFTEPVAIAFAMLATVLLMVAFRCAGDGRLAVIYAGGAGTALVAAIAAKYVAALFLPLLSLHALLLLTGLPRGRRLSQGSRVLVAFAAPVAILGLVGLGASIVLAGRAPVLLTEFASGLMRGWLGLPLWIGFRGLILSSGKSVLLYSPFLLLSVVSVPFFLRRHGRGAILFIAVALLFIGIYSAKRVWNGGGWGPRYLVPILPFLAVVAAPLLEAARRRAPRLLAAFLLLAIPVQVLGVAKDFNLFASMYRQHIYPQLPDAGIALGGRDYLEFLDAPGLSRALQAPPSEPPGGPSRQIGYLFGEGRLDFELVFREPRTTWLSLYVVDFDRQRRRQTIHLRDARGTRTYRMRSPFEAGVWLGWQVEGSPSQPVTISVIQEGHDVAALSALAFDPLPPESQWTVTPTTDWRTKGRWLGRYGRDGFILFAWRGDWSDVRNLPPYIASYRGGERVNLITTESEVAEVGMLYAPPFSPILGHAWLLAADAVHIVLPDRLDLVERVLAAPPWRWWGLDLRLPHPEYGLGLNLWPARLYTDYPSHPRLIAVVLATVFVIEGTLILATIRLLRAFGGPGWAQQWWPRLASGGLLLVITAYNIAQFRV